MKFKTLILTFIVCFLSANYANENKYQYTKLDISIQKEIEHSIVHALRWLNDQQEDDGSWRHYPAITALVLSSFLHSHPSITEHDSNIIAGLQFLEQCVQPDGGIYVDDMGAYNTSICLMTLQDTNDPQYQQIIKNAKKYLMGLQIDEELGASIDSLYYGGVGYATTEKPADLSNLQWALEAMGRTDYRSDISQTAGIDTEFENQKKFFWDKAIIFLENCQNLQKVNKQDYASNDGGFMYKPGYSKAGGTQSYGGMTYAGLKSFIYANVSKDDKRVQAAFNWISDNFDVAENPGLGEQGLYYYYHTMAKALNVYNIEVIIDGKGDKHQWRTELADQLLKIQTPEGFWINNNGRWWENDPVLVTAYVILALEEIIK